MKKKVITTIVVIIDVLMIMVTALIVLCQRGILVWNQPQEYEVKGIDVSEYQGEIDWETLSKEGIVETKSMDGIITKIEGKTLFIENRKQETKKVTWENTKIINNRTEKEMTLEELKEQDKIQISDVICQEEEYVLTKKSSARVTKNLRGNELKQEMLEATSICLSMEKLEKHGKSITITGKITDYYSEYEPASFEIQVEVDEKTQIFSETKNQWEELQKMKERGDTIFVELRETEKEQGKLVVKNIEVLGC